MPDSNFADNSKLNLVLALVGAVAGALTIIATATRNLHWVPRWGYGVAAALLLVAAVWTAGFVRPFASERHRRFAIGSLASVGLLLLLLAFTLHYPPPHHPDMPTTVPTSFPNATVPRSASTTGRRGTTASTSSSSTTTAPPPPTTTSAETTTTTSGLPKLHGLEMSCTGLRATMRIGSHVQVTYEFESDGSGTVGLGVGLYDDAGNDQSDGNNDVDSIAVSAGPNRLSRVFDIPAVATGPYELDGEVWPANKVGSDSAETLLDGPCVISGASTFKISH